MPSLVPQGWVERSRQLELALAGSHQVGMQTGVAKYLNSSREAENVDFDMIFDFETSITILKGKRNALIGLDSTYGLHLGSWAVTLQSVGHSLSSGFVLPLIKGSQAVEYFLCSGARVMSIDTPHPVSPRHSHRVMLSH